MKALTSVVKKNDSRNITLLVFLFFFLVMLSSSGGHLDVWDGKGYFLLTENIVKHHSLILYPDLVAPNQFDTPGHFGIRSYFAWLHALIHEGNYLQTNSKLEPTPSNASPLLALIGVPFYTLAETIHYSTAKFTSYFSNSLILALTSTVVFAFASDFYGSKKIGFALSLVAGVGSFAWPYVSTYFEQPLTGLILISCLYFLHTASKGTKEISKHAEESKVSSKFVEFSPILAGLFLGLQSFAHAGTIMIVPGIAFIGAYIFRRNKAKFLKFFAAFFLLVAVQLYINEVKFGSITEFGYGYQAAGSLSYTHKLTADGLYGLLISPGLGLITYFPLIALLPLSVYYVWRKNRVFCLAFLYSFFSLWIFYGTLQGVWWTGLGGWGPRYMITIIPVLTLMSGSILSYLSRSSSDREGTHIAKLNDKYSVLNIKLAKLFRNILKILFSTLSFSGFIINLLGVLVWYQMGFTYGYGYLHVNQLPDQANNYRYFAWYPKYSPVLLHWKVLTTEWWQTIRAFYPTYFGWVPCIPDNFLYCNFGIAPVIAVLLAILSIGFVIVTFLFDTRLKTLHTNKFQRNTN